MARSLTRVESQHEDQIHQSGNFNERSSTAVTISWADNTTTLACNSLTNHEICQPHSVAINVGVDVWRCRMCWSATSLSPAISLLVRSKMMPGNLYKGFYEEVGRRPSSRRTLRNLMEYGTLKRRLSTIYLPCRETCKQQ